MTKAQALKLARAKWGEEAFARGAGKWSSRVFRYAVGYFNGAISRVMGAGDSWEDACKDAGLLP